MRSARPGEHVHEAAGSGADLGHALAADVTVRHERLEDVVEERSGPEETVVVGICGPLLAEVGNRSGLKVIGHRVGSAAAETLARRASNCP